MKRMSNWIVRLAIGSTMESKFQSASGRRLALQGHFVKMQIYTLWMSLTQRWMRYLNSG